MRRIARVTFLASMLGCTSIDPGDDPVPPQTVFDANYFYCYVEPGFIFGPNTSAAPATHQGGSHNGCHFNPSAVSGMVDASTIRAIDCGGGDVPLDLTQVGQGSPAQSNFESASLEMSADYTTAPIFVRPSSYNGQPPSAHPRAIFDQSDPFVNMLLSTWASK